MVDLVTPVFTDDNSKGGSSQQVPGFWVQLNNFLLMMKSGKNCLFSIIMRANVF